MELSIIIVSWNVKKELITCLKSIKKHWPQYDFETIVVDNASTDGTSEMISGDFPDVIKIENKENRGFAAANNQGVKIAKGRYILFLNPDTRIEDDTLNKLISFMHDNPDIGACGPKLLNEDGTIQSSVRRFPTFRAALYRHTILNLVGLFRGQYHKWLMKDFTYDVQADVCQLMGAALLVRSSVIKQVGTMDEVFFMYFEEVDLCYRIKQAGWRIVFTPDATVTHFGGCSARQVPVGKRIFMLKSLITFFKKNYGDFRTKLFAFIFKPLVILMHFYYLCREIVKYIFTFFTFNNDRRLRCIRRMKNSALFIRKYSCQVFKI